MRPEARQISVGHQPGKRNLEHFPPSHDHRHLFRQFGNQHVEQVQRRLGCIQQVAIIDQQRERLTNRFPDGVGDPSRDARRRGLTRQAPLGDSGEPPEALPNRGAYRLSQAHRVAVR